MRCGIAAVTLWPLVLAWVQLPQVLIAGHLLVAVACGRAPKSLPSIG